MEGLEKASRLAKVSKERPSVENNARSGDRRITEPGKFAAPGKNFLEGGDACLPACLRKRRANPPTKYKINLRRTSYIKLLLNFHPIFPVAQLEQRRAE